MLLSLWRTSHKPLALAIAKFMVSTLGFELKNIKEPLISKCSENIISRPIISYWVHWRENNTMNNEVSPFHFPRPLWCQRFPKGFYHQSVLYLVKSFLNYLKRAAHLFTGPFLTICVYQKVCNIKIHTCLKSKVEAALQFQHIHVNDLF